MLEQASFDRPYGGYDACVDRVCRRRLDRLHLKGCYRTVDGDG
jgi:hypothetical protein